MIYDHNLDDFGWYEVGQRRYYNKSHALYDHIQSREPIHWNLNDDVYSQYNWNQEPTQSLKELYAARARDLRERYDYLVLHFSGGSDSCNILETFVDNKIVIDEIITRGSFDQCVKVTGVVPSTDIYAECLPQAAPLAQWVKDNHFPHVKISVVETSSIIVDYFRQNPNWAELDWNGLSPGMCIASNLDLINPEWRQLADRGKKVAHIYGVDKPRIFRHKQYFYTRWCDTSVIRFSSTKSIKTDHPQYIECFYWGKRTVLLQIKQLHVLKNYIKKHNVPDTMFDLSNGRPVDNFIASVVYDRKLPLTVEHKKEANTSVIQDKDAWFLRDMHSDAYVNWRKGVEYLSTQLPSDWFDQGRIQGLWSKNYYLGE